MFIAKFKNGWAFRKCFESVGKVCNYEYVTFKVTKEGIRFLLMGSCHVLAAQGKIPASEFTEFKVKGDTEVDVDLKRLHGLLEAADYDEEIEMSVTGLGNTLLLRSKSAQATLDGNQTIVGEEMKLIKPWDETDSATVDFDPCCYDDILGLTKNPSIDLEIREDGLFVKGKEGKWTLLSDEVVKKGKRASTFGASVIRDLSKAEGALLRMTLLKDGVMFMDHKWGKDVTVRFIVAPIVKE